MGNFRQIWSTSAGFGFIWATFDCSLGNFWLTATLDLWQLWLSWDGFGPLQMIFGNQSHFWATLAELWATFRNFFFYWTIGQLPLGPKFRRPVQRCQTPSWIFSTSAKNKICFAFFRKCPSFRDFRQIDGFGQLGSNRVKFPSLEFGATLVESAWTSLIFIFSSSKSKWVVSWPRHATITGFHVDISAERHESTQLG